MSEAEFTLPSAAAAESPAMEVSGYTITPTSLAVLIAILLGFVLCLGFALWHARNVCADHGVYCLDRYCFCCCRRGEGKGGNDGDERHGEGLDYPAPTMTFSGGEEEGEEGSSTPTGSNSGNGGGGSSNGSGRSGKRRSPNGTQHSQRSQQGQQPRGVAGDNSSVLTPEPTEMRATSCGRKPTTASRYSHTPGTAHIMRNYDFRNDVSTVMGVGGTDGVGGGEGGGGVGDWSVMAHSYLKSPDSPSTYGGSEDGRGGGNDKSSKSRGDGATTGGSGNVGNRDDANDVSSLGDGSAYESGCEEGGGGKDGGGLAELAKIQEEEVWRDEQTRKVAGAGDGVTEVVPAASRRDDGKDGGTGANGGDVEKNAAGHDDDDHDDDDDNFDYADNNTSKSSVFGRLDFSALWGGGNGGGGADQPDIEEGGERHQDRTDRNKGGGNSSMLDFSSLWKAGEEQQQEQGQAGRARARARAAKVGSGRGIEALGTVEEAGDSNMLDISQDSESHVRVL